MEDDNSMSNRILQQLEDIINSREFLKEFTIVPTEENTTNKSPVLFEELHLGLESWCVKHIYKHVCTDLFKVREQLAAKKLTVHRMEKLNRLLIGALLINPNMPTFWNMKRELVEYGMLDEQKELHFAKIALSSKSKSNEAFSYRRWLLTRILRKFIRSDGEATRLIREEFNVVNMAAENSPNNYHAWSHRIWCVENIGSKMSTTFDIIYNFELEMNYRWISLHVSEHTGYHYRQYLMNITKDWKKINSRISAINSNSVVRKAYNFIMNFLGIASAHEPHNLLEHLLGLPKNIRFLEDTNKYIHYVALLLYDLFVNVDKLNNLFPNHESLWYHRRYLIYQLIHFAYEYHDLEWKIDNKLYDCGSSTGVNFVGTDMRKAFRDCSESGETQPKLFKSQPNKVKDSKLYGILAKSEKQFIDSNSSGNCSAIQVGYCKRYHKWLRFVVDFDEI